MVLCHKEVIVSFITSSTKKTYVVLNRRDAEFGKLSKQRITEKIFGSFHNYSFKVIFGYTQIVSKYLESPSPKDLSVL